MVRNLKVEIFLKSSLKPNKKFSEKKKVKEGMRMRLLMLSAILLPFINMFSEKFSSMREGGS